MVQFTLKNFTLHVYIYIYIYIYIHIYICFILCLYLLFLYRRMLRLALSAIFVLSLLKTIEGAAGNSLQVNRLSSSISVF